MQNAQKRVDLRGTSANWSAKYPGARFGDLISYQNDGKGCTTIADKVEKA
jgi:hypothetical protein